MHCAGRAVLVACDKFKGTISAADAARALAAGMPTARATLLPMADGGDGFVDSLTAAMQLRRYDVEVTGSFPGSRVQAYVGGNESSSVAVVEMALACGLGAVPLDRRDPLETTSFGLGELIGAAAARGFRRIVVGLGGSSTNDAGLGALQALGVSVELESGSPRGPICGKHLESVRSIDVRHRPACLEGVEVEIATDVTNPFVGPQGAVAVYSGQKGATPEAKERLERAMRHVLPMLPGAESARGAGAAGGAAGGLHAALGASVISGVELLARHVHLEQLVQEADLVVTGEGSYDEQSEQGKVVGHIVELCRKHAKQCVVVCGVSTVPSSQAVEIVSLVTLFGAEAAMHRTADCLAKVGAMLDAR